MTEQAKTEAALRLVASLPMAQADWKKAPLAVRQHAFSKGWVIRERNDVLRPSPMGSMAIRTRSSA